MLVRLGDAITFSAIFYTATVPHDGQDALDDVTATVRNPLGIEIVSSAPAVKRAMGRWEYTLSAGGNSAPGVYTCSFRTASSAVDALQKDDLVRSVVPELDLDAAIDGYTVRQVLRGLAAAVLGRTSGFSGTGVSTPSFWSIDGAVVRVTGTADAAGNRTSVSLELD